MKLWLSLGLWFLKFVFAMALLWALVCVALGARLILGSFFRSLTGWDL